MIKINESMKELVIARIEARMPSTIKLSIGSTGSMSKEEMIQHVKKGDEQGEQIVRMHLNFIKAVTSGEFVKELNKA
ncbi:MAG: hypothetical protein KJ597_02105 [Nanoarchaeota archaeon]|nr:hypothetical protein [Nanoarchaeota archaeon]MBU1622345.1 hypothetical protein [Nanoarchaeota archaeon]